MQPCRPSLVLVVLTLLALVLGCGSVGSAPTVVGEGSAEDETATVRRVAGKAITRNFGGRETLADGRELVNALREVELLTEEDERRTVRIRYSQYPPGSIHDVLASVIGAVWDAGVHFHYIEVVAYDWDSERVLARAGMTANQAYARHKAGLAKSLAWSPMYMQRNQDWTVEGPNFSMEIFNRIVEYNVGVSKNEAAKEKERECPACD